VNANDIDVLWHNCSMYFAAGEHNPPHFHVYYNEYKASVDIRMYEIIDGNLPRR